MTSSPSPRAALIARLRKLSKLTTENGCTEAEAAAAMSVLNDLMREHTISMSELDLRAEASECLTDEFVELRGDKSPWAICGGSIARLYGCRHWRSYDVEDILGIKSPIVCYRFHGLPTDVAAAVSTMAIVFVAATTEMRRLKLTRAGEKHSFLLGFGTRIRDRVDALRAARQSDVHRAPNALVVLKDHLVDESYAKLGLRLSYSGFKAAHDPAAYQRGHNAASNVDLGGARMGAGGASNGLKRISPTALRLGSR